MRKSFYRAAVQTNLFVLASGYTGHLDHWWKSIEKQSAYWMKFSSLMAFSLQSYPQPFLIFFCSKQKAFMKCAFLTSFLQASLSHILYIYQLKLLLLNYSFPCSFPKEILDREWKQRKDYFRKMLCLFGIIIISHYYASYINLNVPQRAFLLKLVFHFLLDLLFKQTHLYGKLFYI